MAPATPAEAALGVAAPRADARAQRRRDDVRIAVRQVGYELVSYRRTPRRIFFTFALPVMFLVIFSALYGNDPVDGEGGRRMLTFFVPGILAYGVIMSSFTNIASSITYLRDGGVLKRVRGTPIPRWAYLFGHLGCAMLTVLAISVLMLLIADVAYGVTIPAHALPGIALTLIVGSLSLSALGFGVARLIKDADSGPMVVNIILLPLTFISGIWGQPPHGTLLHIAQIFPVEMLANALQHAYDPRVHGAAITGGNLLWLAVWGLVGVWLTQRFLKAEAANQ